MVRISLTEWAFTLMAVAGLLVIPLGLGASALPVVGQLAFLL